MRLFLAFTLTPELRREVTAWQKELTQQKPSLRWTPAENLHATLLFLGSVPESKLPLLKAKLMEVAARHGSIILKIGGCKLIPGPRRPRVLALTLQADSADGLKRLQNDLVAAVKGLEIEPAPPKPPHLTLARFPRGFKGKCAKEFPREEFLKKEFASWKNDSFQLIRSDLTPRGPIYTSLEKFS